MARDSSGNYTLPSGNPVITGTPIASDGWANPTLSDLANEMTNSLDRNGRGGMLAPFSFVDGSVAAPGMSWTAEPGTGFYRANAGDMRATVAGADKFRWTAVGAQDLRNTEWHRVASEKHFAAGAETEGLLVEGDGSGNAQIYSVDEVVAVGSAAGLRFVPKAGAATNAGARLELDGEGANDNVAADNFAGFFRVLVNDGLTEAVTWAADATMSQKGDMSVLGPNGIKIDAGTYSLDVLGNELKFNRDAQNYFSFAGTGPSLQWRHEGGTTFFHDPLGATTFYFNKAVALRTAGTTGRSGRAEYFHKAGVWLEVGSGAWRLSDFSGNLTLDDTANMTRFRAIGSNQTVTVNDGALNPGQVTKIYNIGGGVVTINLGTGVEMRWITGAGDDIRTGTSFDMAGGSVAYITCQASSTYELEGNGIS